MCRFQPPTNQYCRRRGCFKLVPDTGQLCPRCQEDEDEGIERDIDDRVRESPDE